MGGLACLAALCSVYLVCTRDNLYKTHAIGGMDTSISIP